MLKIGDFSKLCKVTVKALRYYDELGILKPDYIDPANGYRYYQVNKLRTVSKIVNYKEMGFSLDQVAYILLNNPGPGDIYKMLVSKKTEIKSMILSGKKKLTKVQSAMNELKGEKIMNQVVLKTLPEVIVASMRMKLEKYGDLHTAVPEKKKKMKLHNDICQDPFYCFNINHDKEHKETDVDIEICEAVTAMKKNADGIIYKKIERVEEAACYYHKGPYSSLGDAYAEVYEWIEKNNYSVTGKPRESVIDGCWNKDDQDEWLTEIQVPVTVRT